MYNRHLDTFLKVAELGSFSAAAEALFITPSAVIQQINALEQELGATLFLRSRKGVALTEAGKYLTSEAIDYIRKGNEIQRRLSALAAGGSTICVGTSVNFKVRLLYDLWTLYTAKVKKCDIQLTGLTPDGSNAPETDLVEGIRSRLRWQGHLQFLKICEVPVGFAVSNHHPLAKRKKLSLADLKPYTLLISDILLPAETSPVFPQLKNAEIRYERVPDYSPGIMWDSSANDYVLLCPMCWVDTLFDVTVIPCDWEIALDYGIFYHNHCPDHVREFLEFIRGVYDGTGDCNIVPVF